jgi:hypothetical protein
MTYLDRLLIRAIESAGHWTERRYGKSIIWWTMQVDRAYLLIGVNLILFTNTFLFYTGVAPLVLLVMVFYVIMSSHLNAPVEYRERIVKGLIAEGIMNRWKLKLGAHVRLTLFFLFLLDTYSLSVIMAGQELRGLGVGMIRIMLSSYFLLKFFLMACDPLPSDKLQEVSK